MSGKKKCTGRVLFFALLSLIFFTSSLPAASISVKPASRSTTTKMDKATVGTAVKKPAGAVQKDPNTIRALPDLVVSDIRLTNNCAISYTIRNKGRGGVPDNAYLNGAKTFLKFYEKKRLLGGISLKDADPYGHLKKGGGSESGTSLPGNYNPSGRESIRIVIDTMNIVKETNENNNGLTKILNCPAPIQISYLSIGSDPAGNCFVHMSFNKDGNKGVPLSASKVNFSNRSSWDNIKWKNSKLIIFLSEKQDSTSSTCSYYPCTIHVFVNETFVKDLTGRSLDGDYDGKPGGNFVQDIVVNSASSWGTFNHQP